MPDATTHKTLDKPKKGEYRRKKVATVKAKEKAFRDEVMALDGPCCSCMAMVGLGTASRFDHWTPPERSLFEAAHIIGRARAPELKYKPWNGMKMHWFCHDRFDKSDERKIKILDWWEENRPEHYKMRGWKKPHDKLRASVARRQGSTKDKE